MGYNFWRPAGKWSLPLEVTSRDEEERQAKTTAISPLCLSAKGAGLEETETNGDSLWTKENQASDQILHLGVASSFPAASKTLMSLPGHQVKILPSMAASFWRLILNNFIIY